MADYTTTIDFFAPELLEARIESMDEALKSTLNSLYSTLESIDGVKVKELMEIIKSEESIKQSYVDLFTRQRAKTSDTKIQSAIDKIVQFLDPKPQQPDTDTPQFLSDWLINNLLPMFFGSLPEQGVQAARFFSNFRASWQSSLGNPARTESASKTDVEFQRKQLLNLCALWTHMNQRWIELSELAKKSLAYTAPAEKPESLYLIQNCFQQISVDSEIIQRAIIQRQWMIGNQGSYVESQQAKALLITDKLALKALAPLQGALQPRDASNYPITYFSKSLHIRHTPHNDRILLVGISYDLATRLGLLAETNVENGDPIGNGETDEKKRGKENSRAAAAIGLMAIPHEVGHYVYRHAALGNDGSASFVDSIKEPIQKANEDNAAFEMRKKVYQWREEIFADLYGCLVAGSLSVLGMQALIASSDKKHLFEDDGEHPTPIVRPLLMSEILRLLAQKIKVSTAPKWKDQVLSARYDFTVQAEKLDQNWLTVLKRWGYSFKTNSEKKPTEIVQISDSASIKNLEAVLKAAQEIIEPFANRLLAHADPGPASSPTDDPGPASSPTDDHLSTPIPWADGTSDILADLKNKMDALTNDTFAGRKAKEHKLIKPIMPQSAGENGDTSQTAYENLLRFAQKWNDKGPLGSGIGTFSARYGFPIVQRGAMVDS